MNAIVVDNFMSEEVILAAGTKTHTINMEPYNYNGFFSLQILLAGTGTLKGEYLLSNDGTNFVTPTGVPDSPIFTLMAAGNDMYSFEAMLAKYLRILLTEDGGAQPVTVSAYLALQ